MPTRLPSNRGLLRAGCADAVLDGGMPNDKGAWMLGRAGWCNGRDVKPWVGQGQLLLCRECWRPDWRAWAGWPAALVMPCGISPACASATAPAPLQPILRAPWPPSLPPQVIDVTSQLAPAGQPNEIRYVGLFNGTQPTPEQKTGAIMLSANLVFWER